VPRRGVVWDCATGNGQAAQGLARYAGRVIATDASAEQIAHATPATNVEYRVARAEASGLESASVHVVTVAQALHWLDHERFYDEVRRVLVPHGVVAAWCYGYCHAGEDVEATLREFEDGTVGRFWQPQRRWVVDEYRTILFPFDELPSPRLDMAVRWTLGQLGEYLGTWSAVGAYRRECGDDPVPVVLEKLGRYWGNPDNIREVVWPIGIRVGRVQ
jgi:ubiquinone/menaquinone biosynthesis C-methylase UbiE